MPCSDKPMLQNEVPTWASGSFDGGSNREAHEELSSETDPGQFLLQIMIEICVVSQIDLM